MSKRRVFEEEPSDKRHLSPKELRDMKEFDKEAKKSRDKEVHKQGKEPVDGKYG